MRFALTLWRHYLFMNFFWIKYNTIVIFCQFKNSHCLQNCKRAQITCKNIPLSYHVLYNTHKCADKKTINMPNRNLASFSSMFLLLQLFAPNLSLNTHAYVITALRYMTIHFNCLRYFRLSTILPMSVCSKKNYCITISHYRFFTERNLNYIKKELQLKSNPFFAVRKKFN